MKAQTKGRETFPDYMKQGLFDNMTYSMMTLIPAKKRMMDKVQPANTTSTFKKAIGLKSSIFKMMVNLF